MIDYLLITSTVIMFSSLLLTMTSVVYFVVFDIFTDGSKRFVVGSFAIGALFMCISFALLMLKLAYD
jgi:hypothetical protein